MLLVLPRYSVVVEKDAGEQILAVRKNGAHKKGRKEFSSVQGNDDATIFSSSLHFYCAWRFFGVLDSTMPKPCVMESTLVHWQNPIFNNTLHNFNPFTEKSHKRT